MGRKNKNNGKKNKGKKNKGKQREKGEKNNQSAHDNQTNCGRYNYI